MCTGGWWLQATEVHFIRCVKPNLQQRPRTFDAVTHPPPLRPLPTTALFSLLTLSLCPQPYVRSRLRAAGSLSALKFLKKLQVADPSL